MFDTKIDKLTAKVNCLITLTNTTKPTDYPPSSLLHMKHKVLVLLVVILVSISGYLSLPYKRIILLVMVTMSVPVLLTILWLFQLLSVTRLCESGCPGQFQANVFYSEEPLWDGKQCGLIEKACYLAPGLPWFHKTFNSTTTDYIEMRICGDEVSSSEDSPVGYYEIYVK